MNIIFSLCTILLVYLLIGIIRFCILSFNTIGSTNLKLKKIKKINFSIQIDGKRYKRIIAIIYFILLWPKTFGLKKE